MRRWPRPLNAGRRAPRTIYHLMKVARLKSLGFMRVSKKKGLKRQEGRLLAAPHADALSDLAAAEQAQPSRVGTLSFPVAEDGPIWENGGLIAQIVTRRRTALLLCAGWSVPTEPCLAPIIAATGRADTVVVSEAGGISFQIRARRSVQIGKGFFATHNDKALQSKLDDLAAALPKRRVVFSDRTALLLVCGEVGVVRGRKEVMFCRGVPRAVEHAVRARDVVVLNPTHTRMKNDGTIKAWRRFLSSDGRLYVSASNFSKGSKPCATLHSLWHDGKSKDPSYKVENEWLCYREWDLPST